MAEQFKGTPGPWGVTTRQGSWDWVVFSETDPNIEVCQPFHDGTEENEIGEANARLIAAAPDMLAVLNACRIMLKNRDQRPEEMKLLDAIKAVIAKAEGG